MLDLSVGKSGFPFLVWKFKSYCSVIYPYPLMRGQYLSMRRLVEGELYGENGANNEKRVLSRVIPIPKFLNQGTECYDK